MKQARRHSMNPIALGLTLIFVTVAASLLLIRVAVGDAIPWSGLVQVTGVALPLVGLAGAGVLAGVSLPGGTGLPASVQEARHDYR